MTIRYLVFLSLFFLFLSACDDGNSSTNNNPDGGHDATNDVDGDVDGGDGGTGLEGKDCQFTVDSGPFIIRYAQTGHVAFPDITRLSDGRIGLLYERDDYSRITFAAFSLHWQTDSHEGRIFP